MMLTFITVSTVRSSVLITAVWVLLKISRTRDPSAEKFAWTVVLAASLAMPLLTWSVAVGAIPLQIVSGRVAASIDHLTELPRGTHLLSTTLLAGYLLGAASFSARLMAGLLMGARLRRGAQPASAWGGDIDVRLSTEVQGPVSFGSTVLLPACSVTWDSRTVRTVLAHESEHIRNHDGYRLWLALLCRAIFWFNPLIHWLYHRLTILTELTSDAAAVAVIGDHTSYMEVLFQIAAGTPSVQTTVPMATRSTLPERVRQLLASDERSAELSKAGKVPLGVGVVLCSAMIAACVSRPPLVMAKVAYAPNFRDYYPSAMRRDREQGDGLLNICIDKRGQVASAHVTRSTGYPGLDDAMLKLARAFRFDPATRGGKPVKVCTGLPVRFVLSSGKAGVTGRRAAPWLVSGI